MPIKSRPGDLAEAAFLLRATCLNWIVSKPFSERQAYDFIVDNGASLWRVQVKSSEVPCSRHRYRINLSRGGASRVRYTKAQIDFFAIYIIPDDAWFILSIEDAAGRIGLSFPAKSHALGTACGPHFEAWHRLARGPKRLPRSTALAVHSAAARRTLASTPPEFTDPASDDHLRPVTLPPRGPFAIMTGVG